VVRALAVDDLLLGVEAFAAEAVLPAVLAEVELALVPQGLEERLDDLRLARLAAELRSASCWGVIPAAAAACAILSPCSSVPVRNQTSSPARRRDRAIASATIVV